MMCDEKKKILKHFSDNFRVAEYDNVYDGKNSLGELRSDLIRRTVRMNKKSGARVLEVGSGVGELSMALAQDGYGVVGLDISPLMVKRASSSARKMGIGNAEFRVADFITEKPVGHFDVVIANGVIPYYEDKSAFLRGIMELLAPHGVALITHRNALFNLFALNIGTVDFFESQLMDHMDSERRKALIQRMKSDINGLVCPKRRSSSNGLSRTSEVPFDMPSVYAESGLAVDHILHCFIHDAPPRLSSDESMSRRDLQLQYENDWRGMLLGSQFLVIAHADTDAASPNNR